jgi:hypothetical protein
MCIIKSIQHSLPTEGLIPSWVLGAVDIRRCLVDGVANTHPAVGVHARPTIVLSQLSLQEQRGLLKFICTYQTQGVTMPSTMHAIVSLSRVPHYLLLKSDRLCSSQLKAVDINNNIIMW